MCHFSVGASASYNMSVVDTVCPQYKYTYLLCLYYDTTTTVLLPR